MRQYVAPGFPFIYTAFVNWPVMAGVQRKNEVVRVCGLGRYLRQSCTNRSQSKQFRHRRAEAVFSRKIARFALPLPPVEVAPALSANQSVDWCSANETALEKETGVKRVETIWCPSFWYAKRNCIATRARKNPSFRLDEKHRLSVLLKTTIVLQQEQ